MIRKQIYLSEEMNRKLNELAQVKGVAQAEVIREGLQQYLDQEAMSKSGWDEMVLEMKQSRLEIGAFHREGIYENRLLVAEGRASYGKEQTDADV